MIAVVPRVQPTGENGDDCIATENPLKPKKFTRRFWNTLGEPVPFYADVEV